MAGKRVFCAFGILCALAAAQASAGSRRAETLHQQGVQQWRQQKLRQAFDSFRSAIELQEQGRGEVEAELLSDAGHVALYLADYGTALSYLLRGLEAADHQGKTKVAADCAYLVGYVHRDQNNPAQARSYFQKALELAERSGDRYRTILTLNEIGNVCLLEENVAAALPFKERALAMARSYTDRYVLSACLHDMGVYHVYAGDNQKALPFFMEALSLDLQIGDKRSIIISLTTLANCFSGLGRLADAMAAVVQALATAPEAEFPKDILMVYDQAAGIYEKMGDLRRALDFLKKSEALNQKIFNQEQTRQIAEMQERFESVKRQKENELLRRDNRIKILALEKQVNLRNFIVVLALLVLLLAGVVYWRYRDKVRANRRLATANEEIRSQQLKLEEAYQTMETLARADALTGLPNRRVALEELEREAKRHERHGRPFVVLMGDLNGFKAINDTCGHDAGDAVLKAVSALLRGSLRSQDTLARWGGDEFLILLPETDSQRAMPVCAGLRQRVRDQEFEFQGRKLSISLSLGMAQFSAGKTIEECLQQADRQMYQQKKNRG